MTAMPGAHSCTIDRLCLRGTAVDQRRTLTTLYQSDWGQHTRRWYFIRRLQLRTTEGRLTESIRQHSHSRLALAVDGCRQGASDSEAVYFEDLDTLLSQLSIDLLAGRAPQRWYWCQWLKRFASRPEEDILNQWRSNIDRLPEIVARLQARGALASVWASLGEGHFHQLIASFASHRGLRMATLETVSGLMTAADSQVSEQAPRVDVLDTRGSGQTAKPEVPANGSGSSGPAATRLVRNPVTADDSSLALPVSLLSHWQAVFSDTKNGRPKARLMAALLILEAWNPSLSSGNKAWQQRLLNIAQWLARPDAPAVVKTEPPTSRIRTASAAKAEVASAPTIRQQARQADHVDVEQPLAISATTESGHVAAQENPQSFDYRIHTGFGGLFYLVNVITACRSILNFDQIQAASGSGWRLLFQLAMSLRDNDQAPFDSPLMRLIQQACDVDESDALYTPDFSEQCRLITQRVVEAPRMHSLWNSTLLSRQAEVQLSRSHLDIYFRQQDIDLSLRLAGLDIDPGWVDWLGRVVSFHYHSEASDHG